MVLRALLVALLSVALLAAPAAGLHGNGVGSATGDPTTCRPGGVVTAGTGTPTPPNASLSATTLTAPNGSYDRLRNASAIAAAREAGWLTPVGDGRVASDDVVVHRFALEGVATGLLDGLAATDRTDPTAAFLTLVGRPGSDFDYVGGVTSCPDEVAPNATVERGALRVVPDRDDGRLYLVVDPDRVVLRPAGEPTTEIGAFWVFDVSLALSESGPAGTAVDARTGFGIGHRVATLPRSVVHLSPSRNRTVAGTTTVAPGTDLQVRLRPLDGATETPTATATVARDGSFAARFDLAGVVRAVYEVRVPGVERVDPGRPLVVVGNASAAAVHDATLAPDGRSLRVWATMTHGGLLVVRNASGGVVAWMSHPQPGTVRTLAALLPPVSPDRTTTVVAYRDVDGDLEFDRTDRPYRTNGTVVRVTARVADSPTPDGTPSPTPPGTGGATRGTISPTPRPRATGGTAATTPRSPEPVTGFGAVAAAVALLAGAVATRRRGGAG